MNPRLEKLMIEAGFAAPEIATRAHKLAELIVQDCVNVLHAQLFDNTTETDVYSASSMFDAGYEGAIKDAKTIISDLYSEHKLWK